MRTNWFYDEDWEDWEGEARVFQEICRGPYYFVTGPVRSAIVRHYTDKSFGRTDITERFITDR